MSDEFTTFKEFIYIRRIVNTNATVSHEIARMKFSNLSIFVVDD